MNLSIKHSVLFVALLLSSCISGLDTYRKIKIKDDIFLECNDGLYNLIRQRNGEKTSSVLVEYNIDSIRLYNKLIYLYYEHNYYFIDQKYNSTIDSLRSFVVPLFHPSIYFK